MALAAETLLAEGATAVDRTEAESSAEVAPAAKAPVAPDPHHQGVWVYSQAVVLSFCSERVRTSRECESQLHSRRVEGKSEELIPLARLALLLVLRPLGERSRAVLPRESMAWRSNLQLRYHVKTRTHLQVLKVSFVRCGTCTQQ